MFVYHLRAIGDYSLPIKALDVTDILGKGVYFAETESEAIRDMYIRIREWKSNMISHENRKIKLMGEIQDLYIDDFPEVFV